MCVPSHKKQQKNANKLNLTKTKEMNHKNKQCCTPASDTELFCQVIVYSRNNAILYLTWRKDLNNIIVYLFMDNLAGFLIFDQLVLFELLSLVTLKVFST